MLNLLSPRPRPYTRVSRGQIGAVYVSIYVVFGYPVLRPAEREFLGAYSNRERAQEFVDAQSAPVRENLRVVEVHLDEHVPRGEFWRHPGDN